MAKAHLRYDIITLIQDYQALCGELSDILVWNVTNAYYFESDWKVGWCASDGS